MSDSSCSALICSATARRMAAAFSLASSGRSKAPRFSSSRVMSSSLADLGGRAADIVGGTAEAADGVVDRLANGVAQLVCDAVGLLAGFG